LLFHFQYYRHIALSVGTNIIIYGVIFSTTLQIIYIVVSNISSIIFFGGIIIGSGGVESWSRGVARWR
jgi:hypothetical protein